LEQSALFEVDGCQLVGVREFGREVGVSHTMVAKWINQGKLTAVDSSGKIRLEDGLAQIRAQGLGKFRETPAADDTEPIGELAKENIRLARAKANIYERNDQEEMLRLHRTEDIIAAFEPMVLATNARLEAIPAKVAPLLPGDTHRNMEILTKAIREAQQELSELNPAAVVAARRKRGAKIAEEARAE
jgi:phage terminase Nu1 subunit (DNA packaging protein)